MSKSKEISIGNDPHLRLSDWVLLLDDLIEDYGPNAIMFTDAGHNNINLIVYAECKKHKKYKGKIDSKCEDCHSIFKINKESHDY